MKDEHGWTVNAHKETGRNWRRTESFFIPHPSSFFLRHWCFHHHSGRSPSLLRKSTGGPLVHADYLDRLRTSHRCPCLQSEFPLSACNRQGRIVSDCLRFNCFLVAI